MIASFKITILIIITISVTVNYLHAGEINDLGELVIYDTSNSQVPHSLITTINVDDSGKIWIGTFQGGLGVFDGSTWKVFTTDNSDLPNNQINEIVFDHKNTAWIGTDGGLAKYDGANWIVFTPQNSPMKILFVDAIAVDHDDNIWFGNGNVDEGGLMFLSGNDWKLFTPDNSTLHSRIINDILIDSSNTTWVATNAGLARENGDSWTSYDKANSIMPYPWVDELCLDKQGRIWVGESGNLSSELNPGALMTVTLNGNDWSFNNPSQTGKASNKIVGIACDKRGYVWGLTGLGINSDSSIGKAISVFNNKQWLSLALGNVSISELRNLHKITVDKNNNIWIATLNGIVMLKQDTLAIDALFAQSGTKREFKQHIRQQKRETVN